VKMIKCVEAYLERMRASGFTYDKTGKLLMRFARFSRNANISNIADQDVELFLDRNSGSNNARQRYASFLTKFFIFWHARRHINRIPSVRPRPTVKSTFFPYIYTRSEVRALLDATALYARSPNCCLDATTIKVILLTAYGTGIRINDILNLLSSDLDLGNRTVSIRSLHDGVRTIPISADVASTLKRYLTTTSRTLFKSEKQLFLTKGGKAIPYRVISYCFRQLRGVAAISRPRSAYQPRIQDLRHTFAVHSIVNWNSDSMPREKMLSLLAAYMGRMGATGMERYVQLSPSSYQRQLTQLREGRAT
jgi:integrase/recombinase XerD